MGMHAAEGNGSSEIKDASIVRIQEEGDIAGFLSSLQLKHELKKRNDPRANEYYHEIVLCGGGLLGVLHAEALQKFTEKGLLEDIDLMIGTSTGAAAELLVFGSEDPDRKSLYYRRVIPEKIVNGHPIAVARRSAIDTADKLPKFFASESNTEKIHDVPIPLYVVVTDPDGRMLATDIRKENDPNAWVVASCAIPGLITQSGVELDRNGVREKGFDGGLIGLTPEIPTLHNPQATHRYRLILYPSIPGKEIAQPFLQYITMDPRLKGYPGLRRAIHALNEVQQADIDLIRKKIKEGQHIGMISFSEAKKGFNALCTDAALLKAGQLQIGEFFEKIFTRYVHPGLLKEHLSHLGIAA